MNAKSQRAKILKHLSSGCTVTALQAWKWWGCARLAARINELRVNHTIPSDPLVKVNGAFVAKYRMINK